jgi:hypothetical protein
VGSGAGLYLTIGFVNTASFQTATLNAWQAGGKFSTTSDVTWWLTNGNYIEAGDIQLEQGIIATPFEVRPYGTELSLCYRYFYRTVTPVQSAGASASAANWVMTFVEFFPVPMRTDTPSEVGTPALTCELAGPSGAFIASGVAVGIAPWSRFSIRYEVTSGTAAAYFRSLSRDRQINAEL